MKKILGILVFLLLMAIPVLAKDIPWADSVIHTNPVLTRGLGPEMVTSGYTIITLSRKGQDGEIVNSYTSWMTGRSGEKVWVKFRPGEPVEARCTGNREVAYGNGKWKVETWEAKRVVRCGNPTSITFYVWKPLPRTITIVKQLPPQIIERERVVEVEREVVRTVVQERILRPVNMGTMRTPRATVYLSTGEYAWWEKLVPIASAFVGAPRMNVQGGKAVAISKSDSDAHASATQSQSQEMNQSMEQSQDVILNDD
ncbi:MAG: hypothetical protein Q7K11_00345 [Candidatus Berkelbacteria bacterium]|nr:hypothetical protein [Candidatus Berkelbacteria bacterium]